MKWYEKEGKEQEFIVSTRVRFARNLGALPFESKMTEQDHKALLEIVSSAMHVPTVKQKLNLAETGITALPSVHKWSLYEKHLISSAFVKADYDTALYASEDESISLMVGEEDHLRIQAMAPGDDFEALLQTANIVDDLLGETLHISFDKEYGFLTACPSNLGTGMRASAMLHLPFLETSGKMPYLSQNLAKFGFAVRGTFGEGTKPVGGFYQISNQSTLGYTEEEIITLLQSVLLQVIAQEKILREKVQGDIFEDQVFRAYGTLAHAKILPLRECTDLISLIRVGISMGYLPELSYHQVDQLLFTMGDANMTEKFEKENQDKMRAQVIQQTLSLK